MTGSVVVAPPPKEATPPVEADLGGKVNGSVTPPRGSPRNTDILSKLGTRGRGGSKTDKKQTTGKK